MPSFKIIGLLVLEKKIFKSFAIYSHGGHLGHVTLTIHINFHSPFLRMIHTRFGGIREKDLILPRVGAGLPLGYIYFQNHKYSVRLPIFMKFFPSNDNFPHLNAWAPSVDLAIR